MLCLRCSRGINAFSSLSITSTAKTVQKASTPLKLSSKRTFTTFTPLRPTIFPSSFRPSTTTSTFLPNTTTGAAPSLEELAILPFKMSTHPALESMQVRCAPRNTFNPSHFVRKRRHGFLSRVKTRKGRMTLTRRRLKRRSTLSH